MALVGLLILLLSLSLLPNLRKQPLWLLLRFSTQHHIFPHIALPRGYLALTAQAARLRFLEPEVSGILGNSIMVPRLRVPFGLLL